MTTSQPPIYTTGVDALDLVLGGGLPAGSTTIIAGLPGTGKTVLAEQFLFANATEATPALYLTTMSEPLEKIIRYLQRFSFFDPERLPSAIHYQDIGQVIRTRGIEALPLVVEELIADHGAVFVVIDSLKATHDLCRDPVAFRIALFDLGRVLTAAGTTALLVGEYGPTDIATLPEFAVADGVVELTNRAYGVRDERTLRVHKLRGAPHLPGEHSFRINEHGLVVFPRLTGAGPDDRKAPDAKVPVGVPELDAMLEGGLWRGSTTLLAGPSGGGKTMLGLQYLLAGARRGEPGVHLAFQESPDQLRRVLSGFGQDALEMERKGLLQILYVSPLELDLVELFGQVRSLLESGRAQRFVIDALGEMQEAAIERSRFRSVLWTLIRYLEAKGVTSLFIAETSLHQETVVASLTSSNISYMADNILLIRYIRPPRDGYDRSLEVVKTRGSAHDLYPRPYEISANGLLITQPSRET